MKTNPLIKLSLFKSKGAILALCLLPPLMFVYLYLITETLRVKANRAKVLFNAVFCSVALTLFLLGSIYLFDELSLYQHLIQPPLVFILCGILIPLLALLIYATILSIHFERQINSEYAYQETDFDYLYRFCLFLFLPFTIWYYHPIFLGYAHLTEVMDEY